MKRKILVYGDSNTWGWNPINKLTEPIARRWSDEERWTGVMQKELGHEYGVITEGLSGRTTVLCDPLEEYRCGKEQLIPVLDSQAPYDLVILFLGTNDLKCRFRMSPQDIAKGAGILVNMILQRKYNFRNKQPKVILVCPPRLGDVSGTQFNNLFGGNEEKSLQLHKYYEECASLCGVAYFNADTVVKASTRDGLHLEKEQHEILGKAIAKEVIVLM